MTAIDLTIDAVHARYRIGTGAPAGTRERLDGIVRDALADSLEAALTQLSADPGEEICVASVAAHVRIPLANTDAAAGAAWSASIVSALATAIAAGGPSVIRYPTRRQALADVVQGVARDDLSRAWAWRQLGLWDEPCDVAPAQAAAALMRVLQREPEAIVGQLAAAARAGLLMRLARRLDAGGVVLLASVALDAAGAPVDAALWDATAEPPAVAASAVAESAAAEFPRAESRVAPRQARRHEERTSVAVAERVLGVSSIAAAVAREPAAADRLTRRPLAALAILEAEPAALLAAPAVAARLVGHAAALIAPGGAAALHDELGDVRVDESHTAERPPAPSESGPVQPGSAQLGSAQAQSMDPAAPGATPGRLPADTTHREESPAVELERAQAATLHGGLLFLLHIVDELAMAAELADTMPARAPRWTLHRLGMALSGAGRDDPACLAFAGLGPRERPVGHGGPEPDEPERAVLEHAVARIVTRLYELVEAEEEADEDLLVRVCARRSEISVEPGWLESRMPLDSATLELRRAGLDLDPGWVPWLGVVVRFVYA